MKTVKYNIIITAIALAAALSLGACKKTDPNINDDDKVNGDTAKYTPNDEDINNEDDKLKISEFTHTVQITYDGSSVDITNPLEDNGVDIATDGGNVTITSTAKAVHYIVSGECTDGSLKIYSDYRELLELSDLTLKSSSTAAINIQCKKTTFIMLTGDSYIADSKGYSTSITSSNGEEDLKACLFSEGQIIVAGGSGSLSITGNNKHAMASDDYIRVTNGNLKITSNANDGIHTNDYIIIEGGTINIASNDEGLNCDEGYIYVSDGEITVKTTAQSAKGLKALGEFVMNGGHITVTTTGKESEGIESKGNMTISGGIVEIESYDDGINVGYSSSKLTINGGYIYAHSTNNDAIDSNGTITINGGITVAIGSSAPEEGLDCDENTFTINGGVAIGLGSGNSKTYSGSSQYSVSFQGSAATSISLTDASGNQVLNFEVPTLSYTPTILFTSHEIGNGTSYTIKKGVTINDSSSTTVWHGLHLNATSTGGSGSTTTTGAASVGTGMGGGGGAGGGGGGGKPGIR